ncbi:MAG: glycosyltransferase family 2 protein [Rhodoferax sp.]|uniref:glycosyltransferase family 2 protein n=1 Tax=Rhodoferax sp. TaxID=50421 RepID=UPI0014004E51|nr:glycosyltransferase family A protein [Rhodoferax sp.]NDP38244.1 glycosyltransferase family 2 protein [Rhodoferax sp.]
MNHNFDLTQASGVPTQPIPGLRVSVLVPTFNRANYITECIDSLLAQTMAALEVIVIDDGSEDRTAELLRNYGDRIRYVRKENGGKPTAVNLGLTLAQGELIWIFDDDDVALPQAIANRVMALQAMPSAGFVYTPHFYGRDGQDGKIIKGRLHPLSIHRQDTFLYELMKGCFFHLATALVRAEAYRAVGGFDTELLSSEDYDMQLRLAQAFPAAYSPAPSFIFRQHTGLRGAKIIRHSENQRSRVFRKFDHRIGQKLRARLNLGDYLSPRQTVISTSTAQRQALLARMIVMASKGCMPEMMEDLRALLALLPPDEVPADCQLEAITEAICTGHAALAITDQWEHFQELISELPRSRAGRTVRRSVATGLFRLSRGYPGSIQLRCLRLAQACRVAINGLFAKPSGL